VGFVVVLGLIAAMWSAAHDQSLVIEAFSVPPDFAHHKGAWGVNGVNWAEMRVTFRLKDGSVLKNARSWARGWTEEPAGWDDIADKYRECCDGILPPARRDESLAMIAAAYPNQKDSPAFISHLLAVVLKKEVARRHELISDDERRGRMENLAILATLVGGLRPRSGGFDFLAQTMIGGLLPNADLLDRAVEIIEIRLANLSHNRLSCSFRRADRACISSASHSSLPLTFWHRPNRPECGRRASDRASDGHSDLRRWPCAIDADLPVETRLIRHSPDNSLIASETRTHGQTLTSLKCS